MTQSQIGTILTELNTQFAVSGTLYAPNIWLEAKEINSINLRTNESIYPDSTLQIKFDSENNLLLTRVGKYVNDEFVVSKNREAADYETIMSITLVKRTTMKSPYRTGRSI
jgi:hypothetical protein